MDEKGRFTPGDPRAGRPKGSENKATKLVREAIAKFANDNAEQFGEWVKAVAEKDPAKAADLYLRAIEYHIPKLARTEVSGEVTHSYDAMLRQLLDASDSQPRDDRAPAPTVQ